MIESNSSGASELGGSQTGALFTGDIAVEAPKQQAEVTSPAGGITTEVVRRPETLPVLPEIQNPLAAYPASELTPWVETSPGTIDGTWRETPIHAEVSDAVTGGAEPAAAAQSYDSADRPAAETPVHFSPAAAPAESNTAEALAVQTLALKLTRLETKKRDGEELTLLDKLALLVADLNVGPSPVRDIAPAVIAHASETTNAAAFQAEHSENENSEAAAAQTPAIHAEHAESDNVITDGHNTPAPMEIPASPYEALEQRLGNLALPAASSAETSMLSDLFHNVNPWTIPGRENA